MEDPSRSLVDILVATLGDQRVLLVLDNCEHLVRACAVLAHELLRRCPELHILATSREVLRVQGETVWPVLPLSLSGTDQSVSPEGLLACEAGRLLIERASAARPDFALTDVNAPVLAGVCRRLDGIPLAIELAAARLRTLGVEELAAHLAASSRVLSPGSRAALERHQTLWAAIDWSYALLTTFEQTLLRRLSVFAGGWSLAAAEEVCAFSPIAQDNVVELLGELVDKSLVQFEERCDSARYRLLETLRQYAAERLVEADEEALVHERHRAWCVRLAEDGERDIWRADQLNCLRRLEREHDNVRGALAWSIASGADPEPGLRIAAAMVRFWDLKGTLSEGTRWLEQLLGLPTVRRDTVIWARALTALGYLTAVRGDSERATALLDECLVFWREFGDPRALAVALFFRGVAVGWRWRDAGNSEPFLAESLAFSRQRGPRWTTYFALFCLGEAARIRGHHPRASTLLEESLGLTHASGDRWGKAHVLASLALLALAGEANAQAAGRARESLALTLELGDTRRFTYGLEILACVAAAAGQAVQAARLFGAAQRFREPIGDYSPATFAVDRERAIAASVAQCGETAFAAAWADGRSLSLSQAVSEALTASV